MYFEAIFLLALTTQKSQILYFTMVIALAFFLTLSLSIFFIDRIEIGKFSLFNYTSKGIT